MKRLQHKEMIEMLGFFRTEIGQHVRQVFAKPSDNQVNSCAGNLLTSIQPTSAAAVKSLTCMYVLQRPA